MPLIDVSSRPIACALVYDVSSRPIIFKRRRAVHREASQWERSWPLIDGRIRELLLRELEGTDEHCQHGSHRRTHYFLLDLLLFLAPLHCRIG